jgi:hypothetical protein
MVRTINGFPYGANIIFNYGVSGRFYGEEGMSFDHPKIMPWPNEDRIKKEMVRHMVVIMRKEGLYIQDKKMELTTQYNFFIGDLWGTRSRDIYN